MFENAGEKVKGLAGVLFVLEIIGSAIWGISMFFAHAILAGIIVIVIGIVSAWMTSVVLYAIGEAAENSKYTAEVLSELQWRIPQTQEEPVVRSAPTKVTPGHTPEGWTCVCGATHPAYVSTCSCGTNKRDIK